MTSRTGCRVIPMVLAVLVLAALVTTPAQAQDFQALLNAVDKLEANLKKMVERESTARQQQIVALQQKIDGITPGEGGAIDNTAIEELQKEIIQLKLDLQNLGFESETAGIDNERWERITNDIHQLKAENMYLRSKIENSQIRLVAGDEAAYESEFNVLTPVSPVEGPPVEKNKEKPGTLRTHWQDGLRLETADKNFTFKFGGRLMTDWAFISGDEAGEVEWLPTDDGAEFRSARFYLSGSIYSGVEFKMNYEFAGGKVSFKDVYLGLRKLPVVGNFRVGHFNEPLGLEQLTSNKYISFLERSLTSAFVPARNLGLMFHNSAWQQRLGWAVGVFREDDSPGKSVGAGEYNYTARLTGLPIFASSERLFHLGVAYSIRSPQDDIVQYRQRPETHLSLNVVDTDQLIADKAYLTGGEVAVVYGPISAQAELVNAAVDMPDQTSGSFRAYYAMASYFLTGEHRNYKNSTATFSRVKPKANFNPEKGRWGAWEILIRYSHLDLDDEDISINGGTLNNVTLGANWYLNPNTRIMWNYVIADGGTDGDATIFQTRFQIDF